MSYTPTRVGHIPEEVDMGTVRVRFTVEVTLRHTEGKFASKDEIAQELLDSIECSSSSVDSIGPDGESSYDVEDTQVMVAP